MRFEASRMTSSGKENSMKNQIVVGHIALIQRSKKQWFTIELLKKLRAEGYDAVGVFAGECREPEYMTELNQKVEQYDLREHVIFLGRRNDIPDLLKMIDILIIPSAFEGFPLAGLAAAAAGVPSVPVHRAPWSAPHCAAQPPPPSKTGACPGIETASRRSAAASIECAV